MTVRPSVGELLQRSWHRVPLHEIDILLAHHLKHDQVFLYSHPEYRLTAPQWQKFQQSVTRRQRGEPIAYITGHKEFFDLDFVVSRAVLIPRPDTELLVETAAALAPAHAVVVDIGTGSGNIAVALKIQRPDCTLLATDISAAALNLARRNAKRHKVNIRFYRGDVLRALPRQLEHKLDLICFNAPYLTKTEARKAGLAFEPHVALTPKGKPCELIERLLQQAQPFLKPTGKILLEIGYNQGKAVQKLCHTYLPHVTTTIKKDLGGFDRVVICSLQK